MWRIWVLFLCFYFSCALGSLSIQSFGTNHLHDGLVTDMRGTWRPQEWREIFQWHKVPILDRFCPVTLWYWSWALRFLPLPGWPPCWEGVQGTCLFQAPSPSSTVGNWSQNSDEDLRLFRFERYSGKSQTSLVTAGLSPVPRPGLCVPLRQLHVFGEEGDKNVESVSPGEAVSSPA